MANALLILLFPLYLSIPMQASAPTFRLGSTSYVYPGDLVHNAARLAGQVQDIELVLYVTPSGEHNLPTPREVRELARIAADEGIIVWLEVGDHAAVLAYYPEFRHFSPEGRFAHYVVMATASGGAMWNSPGVAYSDYENAAGTGQIHLWFPATGS